MRITQKMSFEERLLCRIQKDMAGCHLWLGQRNSKGYGQIMREGRLQLVHRIMYERVHGQIPEGLQIDHTCSNRQCCNPDHLEAVTGAENLRRGNTIAARNIAKTCCPKCGGPYTLNNQGGRRCRACLHAWQKNQRKQNCKL